MSASSCAGQTAVRMPVAVEPFSIWSVTTSARPSSNGLEHIALGHRAQALVPWVVAGCEVLLAHRSPAPVPLAPCPSKNLTQIVSAACVIAGRHTFGTALVSSASAETPAIRAATCVSISASGVSSGHVGDVGRRALQHRQAALCLWTSSGTRVTAVAPLPITTTRLS